MSCSMISKMSIEKTLELLLQGSLKTLPFALNATRPKSVNEGGGQRVTTPNEEQASRQTRRRALVVCTKFRNRG